MIFDHKSVQNMYLKIRGGFVKYVKPKKNNR